MFKDLVVEAGSGSAGHKDISEIQQRIIFFILVLNEARTDLAHFFLPQFTDVNCYSFAVFHITDHAFVFSQQIFDGIMVNIGTLVMEGVSNRLVDIGHGMENIAFCQYK